ncbi:MAG TPA: hypothetical protein VFZ64_13780, partial [Nocardioidaceae bacterium]
EVLDALHRLPVSERRALLMVDLAGVPLDVAARELNVTQVALERQLRSARSGFAETLGVDGDAVHRRLLDLGQTAARATLLRPAAIRREGGRRRRTHTVVAAAVATLLAVGSGAFAHEPAEEDPAAGSPATDPGPAAAESSPAVPSEETNPTPESELPSADDLLTARDLGSRLPGGWKTVETHDNTEGEGLNYVCQQERFADPTGLATLVRTFESAGGNDRTMVQTLEISESPEQAETTYGTVVSWFAGCVDGDVHLARSYDVKGIADQATVLELDGWWRARPSYSVAIARVGQVVTTTVTRSAGVTGPGNRSTAGALATAARKICEKAGGTECGGRPRLEAVAPPTSTEAPGMLSIVDLPPLAGRARPWAATEAKRSAANPAATSCDRAEFSRMGARRPRTRIFLEDGNRLPPHFGLTQTYAVFRTEKRAQQAMSTIRQRFASCEDRDLAAEVLAPEALRQGPIDGSTWRLLTGISEEREVVYDVGFVRWGSTITQLTFVPGGGADLADGDFRALVIRAGQRLREVD